MIRPLQIDFLFPVHHLHGLFVKPENSIISVNQRILTSYHVIIFPDSYETRVKCDMNCLLLARADHEVPLLNMHCILPTM